MSKLERDPLPSDFDTEQARREGGSASFAWNSSLFGRTIAAGFSLAGLAMNGTRGAQMRTITPADAETTRAALAAFAPADEVEGMFASQATALHFAIMEGLRRVARPGDDFEGAVETWGAVADMNRAMLDCVEALDRRRAAKMVPSVNAATSGATAP